MRLLTAIRFTEEIRNSLAENAERLRGQAVKGNFTPRDGFLLILNQLGETGQTAAAKMILDRITIPQFELAIGGFGVFKRPGGDILWEGVERCTPLLDLQRQLTIGFSTAGYKTDSAEYKPYLTLGKDATMKPGFDKNAFLKTVPFLTVEVKKISLMRCDRIDGINSYSELYARELPIG